MSLSDQINQELKAAMKAKDEVRKRTLRAIKSEILLLKTDGTGEEITEDKEIKLLQKMAKQREDSLGVFTTQGRDELAQKEREELAIIKDFLPKQMDAAELEAAIKAIIEKVGASSMKDMGKVMGMASSQFAGKADGKTMSTLVRQLLG